MANQTRGHSLFLQPLFLSSRRSYVSGQTSTDTTRSQACRGLVDLNPEVFFPPQFSQRVRICDNSQYERHQPRWLLLTSRGKHSVWSSFGERRDCSVCCPFQPDFAPCPLRCMLSFICLVDYGIQEVRKVGSRACSADHFQTVEGANVWNSLTKPQCLNPESPARGRRRIFAPGHLDSR